MTKLELIEHLFAMQENAKMKASYTADEVVGMLNAISVKVSELSLSEEELSDIKTTAKMEIISESVKLLHDCTIKRKRDCVSC